MKFCINCGTKIPDVAKFCPSCGYKQPSNISSTVSQTHSTPETVTSSVQKLPMPQSGKLARTSQQTPSDDEQKGNESVDDAGHTQTQPVEGQADLTQANGVEQRLNADNVGKSAVDMVESQIYFGPLTKDAAVVEHKVALGYSDRSDNYVLASTPINWKEILTTFRGLLGLRSKTYILAFEDNGILLMGAIGMQKFTGDDVFIESSRITDIQLEQYPLAQWDHMFLTIDGEVLELLIASSAIYAKAMWFSVPWHLRNAKKVLKYTK